MMPVSHPIIGAFPRALVRLSLTQGSRLNIPEFSSSDLSKLLSTVSLALIVFADWNMLCFISFKFDFPKSEI